MREIVGLRPTVRRQFVAVGIALLSAMVFFAAPVSPADDNARELALLTGDHQKQQFLAGERVEINNVNVADDLFAAGQDIIFDTVSAKCIIAAGMSLSMKDVNADDLILAGGRIDLAGNIQDDVLAAVCPFCPFGGQLNLSNTMQIGDDARLAGREITIDGRIGGDVYAAARLVRLTGEVVGNAKIEAERIVLAPTTRIGGDLLYASPNKPEVPDGAVISGRVRQVGSDLPFSEGFPEHWIWYAILIVMGILLALILLGAALQLVMPRVLLDASTTAVEKPWVSLGRGLAVVILVPVVVALLMATVVGVPIGMVTMAAFFVLLALAFVAICYCIGRYVRGLCGWRDVPVGFGSRTLWTAAGILILVIVGLIPFVGWAIGFLAMIAGTGAVVSRLGPIFGRADAMPATT